MADRFVRRSGVSRGRLAPRRSTQWIGSADDTALTTLGADVILLDQTFPFGEPATIVRTRGMLYLGPSANAADSTGFGVMGMAVVTDAAAAIGVTAIPAPSSNNDDDVWFVWTPFVANVRFDDATGFQVNTINKFPFDSKAMRKVHDGSTAVVMLENDTTTALQYVLHFRMLIKLHG